MNDTPKAPNRVEIGRVVGLGSDLWMLFVIEDDDPEDCFAEQHGTREAAMSAATAWDLPIYITGEIGTSTLSQQEDDQLSSDRLNVFYSCGCPDRVVGPVSIQASALGTPDEWAWSAVAYLKTALAGTEGGALGGSVDVSAAAVGTVLAYVERLASAAGIIPAGGAE
jgi:hypothetical protein